MGVLEEYHKNTYQNTEQSYNPAREVNDFNAAPGNIQGFSCPQCNNKGIIAFLHDGAMATKKCSCVAIRRNEKNLTASGLAELAENCRLDTFIASEQWQKQMIDKAKGYLGDYQDNWFFVGGQVGCGKTHICTAVACKMMQQGATGKYMLWRDDSAMLKAKINDDFYSLKIKEYKKAEILYIDDLFKNEQNTPPTPADIRIAFEIINHRYNNPKMHTIISSELSIDRIIDIDEALGSRIYQKTKKYCIYIAKDKNKNYRMR